MKNCANYIAIIGLTIFLNADLCAEPSVSSEIIALIDKVIGVDLEEGLDEDVQAKKYKQLMAESEHYLEQHQGQAEAWILLALAKGSYAGTQGMGALGLIKEVRIELERSIEIDKNAMGGYANSFLGRLYFLLPAWPISYGSDKKAKKHIEESLFIDSESMENNYSYAQFLIHKGKHEMAQEYLDKAKQLKPIFSSENWVKNMDKQIEEVQQQLDKELKEG